MLLLNHVIVGKITTQKIARPKTSCHVVKRKQRDLKNHGRLKLKKVGSQKKDLKENEKKT